MKCPKCGGAAIQKNSFNSDNVCIRIRKCKNCGENFYTKELITIYDQGNRAEAMDIRKKNEIEKAIHTNEYRRKRYARKKQGLL